MMKYNIRTRSANNAFELTIGYGKARDPNKVSTSVFILLELSFNICNKLKYLKLLFLTKMGTKTLFKEIFSDFKFFE